MEGKPSPESAQQIWERKTEAEREVYYSRVRNSRKDWNDLRADAHVMKCQVLKLIEDERPKANPVPQSQPKQRPVEPQSTPPKQEWSEPSASSLRFFRHLPIAVGRPMVVRLLTNVTWLWVHWLADQRRSRLCPGQACNLCQTTVVRKAGYLFVQSAGDRVGQCVNKRYQETVTSAGVYFLEVTDEAIVSLKDLLLPGLQVRISRPSKNATLAIEKLDYEEINQEVPDLDGFLCRLFNASPALLEAANRPEFKPNAKAHVDPDRPAVRGPWPEERQAQ